MNRDCVGGKLRYYRLTYTVECRLSSYKLAHVIGGLADELDRDIAHRCLDHAPHLLHLLARKWRAAIDRFWWVADGASSPVRIQREEAP